MEHCLWKLELYIFKVELAERPTVQVGEAVYSRAQHGGDVAWAIPLKSGLTLQLGTESPLEDALSLDENARFPRELWKWATPWRASARLGCE